MEARRLQQNWQVTLIFSGSATLCAQQFASQCHQHVQSLQHTAACRCSTGLPHQPTLPEAIKITNGFLDLIITGGAFKRKITSKSNFLMYLQISNFPPEIIDWLCSHVATCELHLLVTCRTGSPFWGIHSPTRPSGHSLPLHVSFSSNQSWDRRDGN